jgi:hypothetical protein
MKMEALHSFCPPFTVQLLQSKFEALAAIWREITHQIWLFYVPEKEYREFVIQFELWSAMLASYMDPIKNNPVCSWVVSALRVGFIPFVAYQMEDRLDQVFLLLYSFIVMKRKDDNGGITEDGGPRRLWKLLLPSLLLARTALPKDPEPAKGAISQWRILTTSWHIITVYLEMRRSSADPSIESFVLGVTMIYVMSLPVWTGLTVLLLLTTAFVINQYVASLSDMEPDFVYAVFYFLELVFCSYKAQVETEAGGGGGGSHYPPGGGTGGYNYPPGGGGPSRAAREDGPKRRRKVSSDSSM